MHVSYGPPGLKGVQQMMAVGDDGSDHLADAAITSLRAAAGIGIAGALVAAAGKGRTRAIALGAALGAGILYMVTRRAMRPLPFVTTPIVPLVPK